MRQPAPKRSGVRCRVESASALSHALLLAGEHAACARVARPALEFARKRRTALGFESRLLATLAEAAAGEREMDRAIAYADHAIEIVERKWSWRIAGCDAYLVQARILRDSGRAAAEPSLEKLEASIDETGAEAYRPLLLAERALCAEVSGDLAARDRCWAAAKEPFERIGATGHITRLSR